MTHYILKYQLLLALLSMLVITACQKSYPKNVESSDEVVLKSIKIVNSGANGNTVLEGIIDETTKTVSFPRLDTFSDFSNLKLEAQMSNGATLENSKLALDFKGGSTYFVDGQSSLTRLIKVVNNKHFREYYVTMRLRIPPFGADFGKPQYYDYSNNSIGNPTYPDFTGQNTRWTGFDGNKVLIVSRLGGSGPHLLNVSDLKQNIINKQMLNLSGVAGGTFAYSSGAQINGHTYVCNLAAAPPLKIYHWTNPSTAPTLIGQIAFNTIPTVGGRYGDNMSVSLDQNGNGYMFFVDNNGGSTNARDILRIKVTNYTTLSEFSSIPVQPGATAWGTVTNVPNSNDYLLSGYAAPLYLINEAGTLSYTVANSAAFPVQGTDARIVNFNRERYLIMTSAARTGSDATVLYVYDITKGATTKDALDLFNQNVDKKAIFSFPLLGPVNGAPGTQSGWYITKDAEGRDQKLTLFAASTDAGFVLIDFPTKSLDD